MFWGFVLFCKLFFFLIFFDFVVCLEDVFIGYLKLFGYYCDLDVDIEE